MSQVISTDVKYLGEFIEEFSRKIVNYIARMRNISLQDESLDANVVIGIPTWEDIQKTLVGTIHIWLQEIQMDSPLSIPIPENFLNLCLLISDAGARDSRGIVEYKIGTINAPAPDQANPLYITALFGETGFFRNYYKMYKGIEYKKHLMELVVGRENHVDGDTNSVTVQTKKYHVKDIPVDFGDEGLIHGLDGFDKDLLGLATIIPSRTTTDRDYLHRLMSTSGPNVQMKTAQDNITYRAHRAAHWVMSEQGGKQMAVRSFIYTEIDQLMLNAHIYTIINGMMKSPAKSVVSGFPETPKSIVKSTHFKASHMPTLMAIATDSPHLLDLASNQEWGNFHSLAQKARECVTTNNVTESLRAIKSRFLTYQGKEGSTTGFIQVMLDHKQQIVGENSSPEIQTLLDESFEMIRSAMVFTDKLVRSCSEFVVVSPLSTTDRNRIPISQKYAVKVVGVKADDKTGADAEIDTQQDFITANGMLKFLSRVVYNKANSKAMTPQIIEYYGFGAGVVQHILTDNLPVVLDFINKVDKDEVVETYEAPSASRLDLIQRDALDKILEVIRDQNIITFRSQVGSMDALYHFTKLTDKKLKDIAKTLPDTIFFPYVSNVGGIVPELSLISAGYTKLERVITINLWEIADAARKDTVTGKPISINGIILRHLAQKGAGGALAGLLPIVGQAASAVLGPGIGGLVGTIGGLIGDLF